MAAPAGTPKPIIDRLNAEVRKAVDVPEVKARLAGMGGSPAAGSPQEMRDRVARELATWTKTVDERRRSEAVMSPGRGGAVMQRT